MIIRKDGKVTIFYPNPDRSIILSEEEFAELEHLIKYPPKEVRIENPIKMWSPCSGVGCKHPSHLKGQS